MGCVGWIHGQAGGGVVILKREFGKMYLYSFLQGKYTLEKRIWENVSLLVSICRANINLKRLGWMVVGVSCFYGVFYLY